MVPPGIEKTPDQAARISQSVDFGHLSDILPFFGVPHFLTLFLSYFGFSILSLFHFLDFLHFLVFVILVIFTFWSFFVIIVIRPYYGNGNPIFRFIRGRRNYGVVVLPSFKLMFLFFFCLFFSVYCRGDSQGRFYV